MSFVWSYLLIVISCSSTVDVSVITTALPVITSPTHSINNGTITVTDSANVRLTCEATGNGTLTYQWRRVSGSLPSNAMVESKGEVLAIRAITIIDGGRYYCVVSDNNGNLSSMRVQVTVKQRPSVNTPSDQQLNIVRGNQQVTLTCEIIGDDITGGYWERVDGDELPNRINTSTLSNDKSKLTITIKKARPTYSGRYRCVVNSEIGSAQSRDVTVTIKIAAPTITRQPTNVTIEVLQNATFICEADGFEVKYEWKYHDDDKIIGNQSSLTISRATSLDEDQYYCVAMTEGGYAFSNNVTLTVNDDIVISQHPESVTLATGNMLTLSVTASGPGNNSFKYQWKSRNSTSLPDGANGVKTSNLKIRSVTTSDSGSYYCVVMNQWGKMMESNNATVTIWPLPVITVNPKDMTIAEGSDEMLTCEATGDGTLNYQWRRVSGSLQKSSGGQTLTIRNIAVDDSGQYYCEVDNGGDKVTSKRAQVTVRRIPKVTSNPSNVQLSIVSVDERVTLTCKVTGDNITGGYWERVNGDELSNRNNISSLSNDKRALTITISRVRPTHSGMYRCVVYSQWGVAQSRNVQVTITIAPPMITTQPINRMITALQNITFTCEAKGFDVEYEWKRYSGSVTGGRQSSLTISRATPLDEDQYYCVAITEGGYAFSNNVTLTVDDLLSVSVTPSDDTVGERGTAKFIATASGINMNNFRYQWKKRGRDSLPHKVSGADRATLTIPDLTKSDGGQYYCIVTNEWGRRVESNDSNLTVKAGLLLFQRHPQDQFVNNRQTVTFECFVNGSNSTLSVTWERNRNQYYSGNVENTVHSNGVRSILTINTATVSDDGKYRCRATNVDGKSAVSNEADLIIIPEIRINPDNVTELIGQNTELICRALGTGIMYQWAKNDILIIPDATSRLLRITNISESDEGMYKCVASNKGGRVESNPATVTVYRPPMIEKLPYQLHAVLGEEFHITCTATNDHDAPMNLTLSWTAPIGVDITTTNKHDDLTTISTLYISNVTHDHAGVYVCTASNGEHQGNNISVTSTLVVEEKSSPPTSLNISDINATSFKLVWSSPTNPHGVINYYTVYYINSSHNQFVQVVNDANFDGTYILTNLSPYTVYTVYVTAVRLIGGDSDRPLEGVKSVMLVERTSAGVPIIRYDNESRIILNAAVEDTFTIDLPAISLKHGLFSYLYIIVLTDDVVTNTESISTAMLLEESVKSHPLHYVAAVVNVSQYVLGKGLSYILGAGDNTTDINNKVFYNRKISKNYLYFFRIFSFGSTLENEVYITTKPQKIKSPQLVDNKCTKNSDTESSDASVIIIAVLAVLLVILLICVIVLTIVVFKLKIQHQVPNKNNSDQHPMNPQESTYELVSKPNDDDINMEKNPAYSVQDTSMLHHYDFITDENNQTKAKQ